MKHKKSQWLMYGLIAGLIGAMIVSVISSASEKDFNIIGASSLALIDASKTAERAFFYIDQSAKYSLQQAVYDLAKNGGISETGDVGIDEPFVPHECGRYFGSYVWLEIKKGADGKYTEKKCFDEPSARDNLEYIFSKKLNGFLANYPGEMPLDNYNYNIKENIEAVGTAKEPMKFIIQAKGISKIEAEEPQAELCLTGKPPNIAGAAVSSTERCVSPVKGLKSIRDELTGKELVDFTDTELCKKGSKCILSPEAGILFLEAQKIAKKKGKHILIVSGYRTIKEQEDAWNGLTPENWAKRTPNEIERRNYVCYPYGNDVEERCPHLSGNAADIQFADKEVKYLTLQELQLLSSIMTEAGWIRYGYENDILKKGEPWHYECCGTGRYKRAKKAGVSAIV